jgi:hemerythrin
MESFRWNKYFITGLPEVDKQHRHLVDIINQFGNLLADNEVQMQDVDKLFSELADYAAYHFQDEENLMSQSKLDTRHIDHHVLVHKSFLEDVTSLYSGISQDNIEQASSILEFLMHWLAYHILGQDQDMGRQIKAIESGMSPQEAFEQLEQERARETVPLLEALYPVSTMWTN